LSASNIPAEFCSNIWATKKPRASLPRSLPKNLLLYADEAPLSQPAAEVLKKSLFSNSTASLNLTASPMNVTAAFIASKVSENFPPRDQSTYMSHVYADQKGIEGWNEIGAPLAKLYKSLNNGASPPAGDPPGNIS